jgi:hypothetical protein
MASVLTRCLPPVMALLLAACMPIKSQPPLDARALRVEHRYLSALAQLEKKQAKTPDYLQQRQDILDEASLYQSQLLLTLRNLMEQNEFARAQTLLQQAAPELPANAELAAFQEEFQRERERYVQVRLDELYQLRGEHLLKEQPLYRSLQGVAGDYELQIAVERFTADATYFARLLREAGIAAMQREDYADALKYLATSNELQPSTEVAAALDAVKRAIAEQREQQLQNRANEREQRYRRVEAALLQTLKAQDYAGARTQVARLRETGLHATDVDRYRRQLAEAIRSYVAARIDSGNKLYAEGHIEAALAQWRPAYALTPTQELKERIEKAEKFLERYQHLKQTPAR